MNRPASNSIVSHVLAIDPGPIFSGVALINRQNFKPVRVGKETNYTTMRFIEDMATREFFSDELMIVIEMVGHYGTGMPAGSEIFDTCVWIGRFIQHYRAMGVRVYTLKRQAVKLNLCGTPRARDSNITQALIDRFAKGQRNFGKGTKKEPGFFHGFQKDIWQAYALGVTSIDIGSFKLEEQE